MVRKRLVYVDMVRGIAILLVVTAHLIQNNVSNGIDNPTFWFINSFHMPAFFMISGYIGQKVNKPAGGKKMFVFVQKKFQSLIVPLLTWSLIIEFFFFTKQWKYPTLEYIQITIVSPGLWFLLTLFQIFILYSIFLFTNTRYNKNNRLYTDLLIIIGIHLISSIYYFWNSSIMSLYLYSIFFYLGVMISKHSPIEKFVFSEQAFLLAFMFFSVLVCHWNMKSGNSLDDLLKLIIAPSAFVVLINVCRRYENSFFSKIVSLWGRYSIEIYVTHWALLCFVENRSLDVGEGVNGFWTFIISSLLAIPIVYLCIGFSKIIEVSPNLRLMMFGRK